MKLTEFKALVKQELGLDVITAQTANKHGYKLFSPMRQRIEEFTFYRDDYQLVDKKNKVSVFKFEKRVLKNMSRDTYIAKFNKVREKAIHDLNNYKLKINDLYKAIEGVK